MTKKIALFDFDGTITSKDTFLEVIKYQKGLLSFYRGIVLLSPMLLFFKLGFIPNWKAKEIVLTYFFKEISVGLFQRRCDEFSRQLLPKLIRPQALRLIESYKKEKVRVVIVTASAQSWVEPWCKKVGVEYITSCLETKDGKLTGKLEGKNCYGVEKVRRIRAIINLGQYKEIYAFGDSKGDLPMFQLSTKSFYKPFKE